MKQIAEPIPNSAKLRKLKIDVNKVPIPRKDAPNIYNIRVLVKKGNIKVITLFIIPYNIFRVAFLVLLSIMFNALFNHRKLSQKCFETGFLLI